MGSFEVWNGTPRRNFLELESPELLALSAFLKGALPASVGGSYQRLGRQSHGTLAGRVGALLIGDCGYVAEGLTREPGSFAKRETPRDHRPVRSDYR